MGRQCDDEGYFYRKDAEDAKGGGEVSGSRSLCFDAWGKKTTRPAGVESGIKMC
jgi:hypothetical protein